MDKDDKKPLDKQVERNDSITIAEVKDFIADAKKGRYEDFISIANRSWAEIEKRNNKGRLFGGNDLFRKRSTRFPLWWSCWKIRQPITLARLPVPILQDTQGDDPIGRTACVVGERLTRSILKTFDAFSEFSAANDDFLVTNFGWGRVYYRITESVEEERVRLQRIDPMPQMGPDGQPMPQEQEQPVFLDESGQEVVEGVLEDEDGYYFLSGEEVTIENEEVYFEAGLFSGLLVDPDAPRWNKVNRVAFEQEYSYRDFKVKFGQAALDTIAQSKLEEHRTGKPIIVYEYWDKLLKECRYLAESSEDFFQPAQMRAATNVANLEEVEELGEMDHSDLYGLSNFFPCSEPLLMNASTVSFWPTPEYFQVCDIIDDVHGIVRRMVLLTRAVRVRFLFDSSVKELQSLVSEREEADGIGIPNLQQALMGGKGDLASLVAYFPTEELIKGLQNMYVAFEQRLNMFYQITGISDLLRGQTSDVEKTYGERQLEGKFALNRIEPFQRKIQKWIKDNYQLMMELALKMFSEETLDDYIMPETLDDEDKQRYPAALELLKSNKRSRFRVDFETDSMIAINQEWKKKQAIDLANTLTKAMESTAQVAESQPELAGTELKVLKHMIGEFSDGKLFIDEIQDSIEQVIERVSQPKQDGPNIDLEKLKLEGQRLSTDARFREIELQINSQLRQAELQQKAQQDSISNQLEQLKISLSNGTDQAEIQLAVTRLQSEIAQGQEALNINKQKVLADVQKEAGKKEMEQLRLVLDARVKAQEITLAEAQQQLEEFQVKLMATEAQSSLQERWATERRLQEEHGVNVEAKQIDSVATLINATKQEAPKAAPVSIDLSKTVHLKAPTEKKKAKKNDNKKQDS